MEINKNTPISGFFPFKRIKILVDISVVSECLNCLSLWVCSSVAYCGGQHLK
jgi:hypothetical protein